MNQNAVLNDLRDRRVRRFWNDWLCANSFDREKQIEALISNGVVWNPLFERKNVSKKMIAGILNDYLEDLLWVVCETSELK